MLLLVSKVIVSFALRIYLPIYLRYLSLALLISTILSCMYCGLYFRYHLSDFYTLEKNKTAKAMNVFNGRVIPNWAIISSSRHPIIGK
jgi:hypothetical protein